MRKLLPNNMTCCKGEVAVVESEELSQDSDLNNCCESWQFSRPLTHIWSWLGLDLQNSTHGADGCATTTKPYAGSKIRVVEKPRFKTRFEPVSTQNWMQGLDGTKLVSEISIPGTHDSAAFLRSNITFITTQMMNIEQQLEAGIRYFDLRCALVGQVVHMCHGDTLFILTLASTLQPMYDFLEANPSEGLIVQIKEDHKPYFSKVKFHDAVIQIISERNDIWRVLPSTPTLDQLRGKIQLLRRFSVPFERHLLGVDVSVGWKNNHTESFTITTPLGVRITIQDYYELPDDKPPTVIEAKFAAVKTVIDDAARNSDAAHWYINFTSATSPPLMDPLSVAQGVNPLTYAHLSSFVAPARCGILLMDYPEVPEPDLIYRIILLNYES